MRHKRAHMSVGIKNEQEPEIVPLCGAVFCLDCESISTSRGNECPACKGHSLLALSKILGGSLLESGTEPRSKTGLFNVTLQVELQQMPANDLSVTLERLTTAISPKLAQGTASFHIKVQTSGDESVPIAA